MRTFGDVLSWIRASAAARGSSERELASEASGGGAPASIEKGCERIRRGARPRAGKKMGDSGEGLIDADSRIQERMEELEHERKKRHGKTVRDPEKVRAYESLKLARKELEAQLAATTNDRRRTQLNQAIAEVDKRIAEASAALDS